MSDFRVLVTGSRTWTNRDVIWVALAHLAPMDGALVVVHGACESGADKIAAEWVEAVQRDALPTGTPLRAAVAEPYPADWRHCSRECNPAHRKWRRGKNGDETYCPTAGHRRNQEMVDAGADLVLAFSLNNSRGTADCVRRAKAAGVRVEVVEG